MKIFIDTADLEEIKTAYSWGIIDGITTNPSLIAKAAEKLISLVSHSCKKEGEIPVDERVESGSRKELTSSELENYITQMLGEAKSDPVSLEVTATNFEEMVSQAKKLSQLFGDKGYNNLVIKIPVNPSLDVKKPSFDGLMTIKRLRKEGIKTNATLIMTPEQALFAAKAGATYVSPFAGRIDDYLRDNITQQKVVFKAEYKKEEYYPAEGRGVDDNGIVSGVDLVRKTVEIFRSFQIPAEIIAASVRNARQARELAATGVDIATIPFYVLEEMNSHHKTAEGMAKFMKDAGKVPAYELLLRED